jgi:hypothetical protein
LIQQQLVATLLAWSLLTLGAAVIGLYLLPRESYRGFWFMNGIWGVIDGMVGWLSFIQEPKPVDELQTILLINIGLQTIYLPLGVFMLTRPKPILKGFGWGILVQAAVLGVIDTLFYFKCGNP